MATFHLNIQSIKRSEGRSATGAAAYRAGEQIQDRRSGAVHDFSSRKDVRHTEILLPSQFGTAGVEWARDRASLWNSAEAVEARRNSRVAREFQVMLPAELDSARRLALARSFARELADRYGVAIDLAIHDPKPGRPESNNFHAHLLATTREVNETGLGAKAGLDMHESSRARLGLTTHSEEFTLVRERWAALTNEALREANIEARVDHRSLEARGIDRKPLMQVPLELYRLEKRGVPKHVAENLRNDYRARMEAHRESSRTAVVAPTINPGDIDEVRRRAVQEWLRIRPKEVERGRESGTREAGREQETHPSRGSERDF